MPAFIKNICYLKKFKFCGNFGVMTDPVLDLEETYAYVHHDSIHRAALNGEPKHSEPCAMVARRVKYQQWQTNLKPD